MQSAELKADLRRLGAMEYDLWVPEASRIPYVLQPGEQLKGVVFGRYKAVLRHGASDRVIVSRGVLLATDKRVVLINKKPLFDANTEIKYEEIRNIAYTKVFITGRVTLRMEIGDISLRTFNQDCARQFVKAVEAGMFNLEGHKLTNNRGG